MNRLYAARVKETTTTTGTGTISLAGAVSGFQTFAAGFSSGRYCYYTILDGTAWEQGIGFFTSGSPSTIARTAVLASSNGGAALNLGVGTKTVFCDSTPDGFTDDNQLIYLSYLSRATLTGFVMTSGTAHYVYVGRTSRPYSLQNVEFNVSAGGSGGQTAEVGIFSTPQAPDKTGQTLTKIVASGTVDALTSAGPKRNTSAFNQLVIPGGVHLWAAVRTAMATTQPTIIGVGGDMGQGHLLEKTGSGALTGITTETTAAPPSTGTGTIMQAPDARIYGTALL